MNAILQLEPTWQQWIANNINRGVAYHKIINTLFERGFYGAAYELMSQQSGTINIPYMDMSHNSIVLPDKTVRLASTFYPPFVAVIEGFLSHKECDQLISSAEGNMRDSRVVSPVDGTFAEHDARTSKSHGFQRGATPLITTIENRIAALLHWPVVHGEGLQVLKYGKGQEYRPHYDFFDPKNANYQKTSVKVVNASVLC